MDESWRMSMGGGFLHHNSPRRQHLSRKTESDDDFYDVFGGPPRTVVDRRSAAGFYAEVFSPPAEVRAGGRRNLPGFNIPLPNYNTTNSSSSSSSSSSRGTSYSNRGFLGVRTGDGFYDDIFGSFNFASAAASRDRRSTANSKSGNNKWRSNSSSSDRDFSSSRPCANRRSSKITNHDAGLSSFASKLRPIVIPSRQHESSQPSTLSSFLDFADIYCPHCRKKAAFVDTSSSTHNFFRSNNYIIPTEKEPKKKVVAEAKQELVAETEGASAVDEAIAWARERCWNQQRSDREIVYYSEDYLSMEVPGSSDSTFSFVCNEGDD